MASASSQAVSAFCAASSPPSDAAGVDAAKTAARLSMVAVLSPALKQREGSMRCGFGSIQQEWARNRKICIYYHMDYIIYIHIICRLHIICRFYIFILYTLYMISIYIYIHILTSIWAPSLSFDLEPRLFFGFFFLWSEADEIQRFWVLRLWTTRFIVSREKGMHFLKT